MPAAGVVLRVIAYAGTDTYRAHAYTCLPLRARH